MALIDKASLLFVPSVVAEGKAFNILPSGNRAPDSTDQNSGYDQTRADFDFDRGSNAAATRIGSDGLIKKYRENLLLQSNAFDTTWATNNASVTSGQSGYDGSSDAWLLESTGGINYVYQIISSNAVQTFSIYAKAGNTDWMRINILQSGTNANNYYDIANGVKGASPSAPIIDDKIESVGDGWYRISIAVNISITQIRIQTAVADGNEASVSGDNIYIQNAQLESGLVATDVLTSGATTAKAGVLVDLPRVDYSSGSGALLLESSRTNIATLSEYFAGWNNQTNVTINSNYTTSPEGLNNASRLLFTANGYIINIGGPSQSSGTQYTLSCYAKRNDSGTQNFGFFKDGSGSVDSAMSLTNEWQRFDYTYTASNNSQLGLAGLNGADVSVYGFQVEASASYPTSYIPNHGTSGGVTRAADSCSVTGVSDVIGQAEGTLYAEINVSSIASAGTYSAFRIWDGSANNEIAFLYYPDGRIQATSFSGGSLVVNINEYSFGFSAGVHKIAFAYKANDYALYIDGSVVGTDTSASVPATNQMDLFYNSGGTLNHKQAALFNERLSNAELATLTTL